MTQDKARKAAVRARMAQIGEPYTEAARQLTDPVSPQDVLDGAMREFGIPDGALSLVLRHMRETSEYPLLPAGARSCGSSGGPACRAACPSRQ